jgi:hypothetical protein
MQDPRQQAGTKGIAGQIVASVLRKPLKITR